MKFKLSSIFLMLFFSLNTFAQQIDNGLGLQITDFNVPIGSGAYNGYNAIGANPDKSFQGGWQHLLVVRHPNGNNNYQLQIASSMSENDKLYFRKLASGTAVSVNSNWNEIATRGVNNFVGNQNIAGNQSVTGNLSIGQDGVGISMISGPANSGAIQIKTNSAYGGSANRYLRLGWMDNTATFAPVLSINDDLNVGIGITNPDEKLAVKGKIHAEEVRIDLSFPAPDYVFANDYKLKSLKEVEEFIKENSHLPEIPSAKEIEKNGLMLAEMNMSLLKKIEELTLYIIVQDKKYIELEKRLEKRLEKIEKIEKIEKK